MTKRWKSILPLGMGALLGAALMVVPAHAQSTTQSTQAAQQQDRDRDNAQPMQQAPSTQLPQDQDKDRRGAVQGDRATPQSDMSSTGDEDMSVQPQVDNRHDNMNVQPRRDGDNMAIRPEDRDRTNSSVPYGTDRRDQDRNGSYANPNRDRDNASADTRDRDNDAVSTNHEHRRKHHAKRSDHDRSDRDANRDRDKRDENRQPDRDQGDATNPR